MYRFALFLYKGKGMTNDAKVQYFFRVFRFFRVFLGKLLKDEKLGKSFATF